MAIKRTSDVSGMKIDFGGFEDLDSIILEFGDKTSSSKMLMTVEDGYYIYVDGKNFTELELEDGSGDKYLTEELLDYLQDELREDKDYWGKISKVKLDDLIKDKHLNLEYMSDFLSLDKSCIKGALENALEKESANLEASGSKITLTLNTVDCINDTFEYLKNNDGEELLGIIAKLFDCEDAEEFEEEIKDELDDYKDDIADIEIVFELKGVKISSVTLSYEIMIIMMLSLQSTTSICH